MGPAATSLALLCLCSLSLGGPTGTANASPTQVRGTQWAPLWLGNTGTLLLLATHFCFQMLLLRYSECMCMCSTCARDANGKKKTRAKTIPDDYDFFFILFAQAKKTCPKLQKLCLDFEEGGLFFSFLSFFPPSVNGTEMLRKKF